MMYLNEVQITNTHAANLIEEGKLEQAYHLLHEGVASLSNCVLAPAPIEHGCSSQENGKLSTDDADAEEEQDLIMREEEQDDQEVDDEGEPIVPIDVYSLEEEHAANETQNIAIISKLNSLLLIANPLSWWRNCAQHN